METGLIKRLRDTVGAGGVFTGAAVLEVFIDGDGLGTDLVRVLPRSTEEAGDIVVLAREAGLPVFSVRSRYIPEGLHEKKGVLIDPARLDYVKKIDPRNMIANIGAGVTFEKLGSVLNEVGMKLLMPACADSPYVIRSYLDRDVLVGEGEHRHTQLSIFHAILADGRLWASGSHQMSDEGRADFHEDQGPQLSPFFGASEDIYGIPVYGIVYIYPAREERRLLAFGFDEIEGAVRFAYKVSREEHCFELVGGDPTWWAVLTEREGPGVEAMHEELPPWTVLLSLEHRPELVEVQEGLVLKDAEALGGGRLHEGITVTLGSNFGRPWYLWDRSLLLGAMRHVFCYTFADRVAETFELAGRPAGDAGLRTLGRCFIPVYRGGAFYCETDIHHPPDEAEAAAGAWRGAYAAILDAGAMVDKPRGELARMVFARARPSYMTMMRRLKRILDPEGIMNPGQLLEEI